MSNVVYNPLGQPTSDSLGTVSGSTGISETHTFNNRGELTSAFSDVNGGPGIYHLSGITYAPNGDFKGATDSILGGVWNYTYDDFNRLATTVQTSGVAFNYKYDRFGNRWQQNVTAGSGPAPQYAFDANNRIIPTNCTNTTAFCYDAAGNMLQDTFHTYSYDAEGRILTVDATSGSPTSYAYDAMGHRAQRTKGGVVSYFGYDLAGHSIVEYQTNPNLGVRFEAYAGPRHLVTYSHGFTYFDFQDVVGTERVHITQEGAHSESTFSLPFGDGQFTWGDIGLTGPTHFTGKERDAESNLDYFGARYYGSTQGRFMTPDWASGSARVDAGHSVDKAGGLTITSRAFAADASGSVAYGTSGLKVSGQAGVVVASEKATEGSIGTTSTKAVSADVEAHAGASLTGLSAGAGANADVVSATQTVKLGPVTLSATGNVGIGAEASASVSTTGVSASAGVTPGFGGAVSVSISFGQGSVSGGASVQSTSTGTGVKTTTDKPIIKPE